MIRRCPQRLKGRRSGEKTSMWMTSSRRKIWMSTWRSWIRQGNHRGTRWGSPGDTPDSPGDPRGDSPSAQDVKVEDVKKKEVESAQRSDVYPQAQHQQMVMLSKILLLEGYASIEIRNV